MPFLIVEFLNLHCRRYALLTFFYPSHGSISGTVLSTLVSRSSRWSSINRCRSPNFLDVSAIIFSQFFCETIDLPFLNKVILREHLYCSLLALSLFTDTFARVMTSDSIVINGNTTFKTIQNAHIYFVFDKCITTCRMLLNRK